MAVDSVKVFDKDAKTVDGEWRTGVEVNDGRAYRPKVRGSALTSEDYEKLPHFTSSPVIDVPLPVTNYSGQASTNTIRVRRDAKHGEFMTKDADGLESNVKLVK